MWAFDELYSGVAEKEGHGNSQMLELISHCKKKVSDFTITSRDVTNSGYSDILAGDGKNR